MGGARPLGWAPRPMGPLGNPSPNPKLLEFRTLFFGWAHLFYVWFILHFILSTFYFFWGGTFLLCVSLCAALVPASNPYTYLIAFW